MVVVTVPPAVNHCSTWTLAREAMSVQRAQSYCMTQESWQHHGIKLVAQAMK